MKLPKQDKLLHILAGIYIFLIANILLNNYIALSIAMVFGIGKELLWDKRLKKGTPEIADALATILGAMSVFLLTLC